MSIPLLGIEQDVKGRLEIKQQIERTQDSFILIIEEHNILDNKIYERLFEDKKIGIEVRVSCDSTFFERFLFIENDSKKSDLKISFNKLDVNFKIRVSYYLKATKEFELDTNNEFFDEFYDFKLPVQFGAILSRKYENELHIIDNNISLDIFQLEYNENVDYMKCDFSRSKIYIFFGDEKLYKNVHRIKKQKKWGKINIDVLFKPIILEALNKIENRQEQDDIPIWEEVLLTALDLEKGKLENMKFDKKLNLYYNKFIGGKKLQEIYNQIKKVK
tara:strand:- start:374 stop:1195 length:822 start_codon:yes stop_codon:yes gene_type:complete